MNRISVVVVAAAAAILMVSGNAQTSRTQTATAGGQLGRYQLLAAEHNVEAKGVSLVEKDIFRIDTATGETSFYVADYSTGQLRAGWVPIR